MKKLFLLLAVLLMAGSGLAMANSGPNFPREDDNTPGYTNYVANYAGTSSQLISRPALIYGLTVYASSANAHCDLYDTASFVNGQKPIAEVGQATQYSSYRNDYHSLPINLVNGAYVVGTNGSCFVEYR